MKHLVVLFLLLFSLHTYSQDTTMYTNEDGSIEISCYDSNNVLESSILIRENHQEWITYYDNSQIDQIAFYINGHKEGKWVKYDIQGNLVHFAYYQSGHLIKIERFFPLRLALR